MALSDHIGILAHSSLDMPRINRQQPEKPASFYAQIAFPPSAAGELQALADAAAPGGNLAGLEVGVRLNGQLRKPLPGIPADWLVVRSSTQFAPYVADSAGNPLDQSNRDTHAAIKTLFYAGKNVRAALSAYYWAHTKSGRRGVSYNLQGVMAAGEGERLNIGAGVIVNAFQRYAEPTKAASATPVTDAAAAAAHCWNALTLTQAVQSPAAAASANPFAQTAAEAANPFAAQ